VQEDSLKKRYSLKLLANIISGVIGAILIAIVPKALGPLSYGHFVYLQDFFTKLLGFLDSGSSLAFFTKLSANTKRKELLKFYFFYALFILLFSILGVYLINNLGFTDTFFPNIPKEYIFFGLVYAFLLWLVDIFVKISDANALTASIELIKITHKIVMLIILILFIYYSSFNLELYFYFQIVSLVIFIVILGYVFIYKNIFNKSLIFIKVKYFSLLSEFLEFFSPLIISTIVGIIIGFIDIWLLQKYGGSTQTAFYGLAYSIAGMSFLFTSAMTPIITREFSKYYEQKDLEHMKRIYIRYIPMLYSISAYFGLFVVFQSENLLMIFTDERFAEAYVILILMGFYPIHQTYGQLCGSLFFATGDTVRYRNIGLLTSFIGLAFSLIFLLYLDLEAVGLAIKMLLIQFIYVNILLFYNSKLLNLNLFYFIKHQIYSILFFLVLAFLSSYIISFDSKILEFLFSGTIYTLLVIISTIFFPQVFGISRIELMENLNKLKSIIKK
jgi:O-antigen/teichoic acid export membrane protein